MVKVIGPVWSLGGFQPLRKPRTTYPPPPPPDSVLVTAGSPPPNPDCTGWYYYAGINDDEHYYKRTTEPFFYLYWSAGTNTWFIRETIESFPEAFWSKNLPINGTYEGDGFIYTGKAVASEPT